MARPCLLPHEQLYHAKLPKRLKIGNVAPVFDFFGNLGSIDPWLICTSHVERVNLTTRTLMKRFMIGEWMEIDEPRRSQVGVVAQWFGEADRGNDVFRTGMQWPVFGQSSMTWFQGLFGERLRAPNR